MKQLIIIAAIALLVAIGAYAFISSMSNRNVVTNEVEVTPPTPSQETAPQPQAGTSTEPIAAEPEDTVRKPIERIGSSAGDRDILAYHFGTGERTVLFVGGIHGGYSWNTAALAYELIAYLSEDATRVPEGVTVTVIPVLNPDGLAKVVSAEGPFTAKDVKGTDADKVAARFNANTVDLNRNFDCEWNATGTWQNRSVSGGDKPFSEPEAIALRDYVLDVDPEAVVVWYSAAGGVYASNCKNGIMAETKALMNTYAKASGYSAYDSFDYYAITGDMVNWLAKNGIPAVSVLLTDHTSTEWAKNKAGIDAVLARMSGE